MKLIERREDLLELQRLLGSFRVAALLGPRQSGKTTLAGLLRADERFDLENPRDLARLEHPQLALERCRGLIVIDEIQRKPDLFPLLRYMVDNQPRQKYLILGSASPDLIRQSSESLAGRIAYHTLFGFRTTDLPEPQLRRLWLRGGLPRSFLARSSELSNRWREDYLRTFLERDIPGLGIRVAAPTLRRFWQMASHYHGSVVNISDLGRSLGVSDTAIRHFLEILEGTFMIRLLQPWHENIGRRLVKRPKLYVRDSGIYHSLLSIETERALECHPKLGSSWEGFALESVWRSVGKADEQAYFWATHTGAEVDLFWRHDGQNWACEFKYADAPQLTRSMHSALQELKLRKLWVVYPGPSGYPLHKNVEVLPLQRIPPRWQYS